MRGDDWTVFGICAVGGGSTSQEIDTGATSFPGTHKKSVKLAEYDLQVGQDYKLVLRIGKKWVGADFSTVG